MYDEKFGGRRSDIDGYCRLVNGSEIFFIGLDTFDEQSLKSFEINSVVADQAEELDENIYLHLDSRIGRWKAAQVPPELAHLPFKINAFTGLQMPPSYMMLGCNPDSRLHWIFRRYHPESLEWLDKYRRNHVMIQCASTENPALDPELLQEMMSRDPEWVARYVTGTWGISDGTIHVILPDSIIEPSSEFLRNFLLKARLFRVLDHGESSPTVCLWFAVWRDYHLCYREYYQPDRLISEHRQAIADLSVDEKYDGNYADPSIFSKTSQKYGGKWSVADEYLDRKITSAPTISWMPADNNEFPIRNRINELLRLDKSVVNPLSGKFLSPRLYFVKRNEFHLQGCYHVLRETGNQRREQLGTENGKPIYSDARAKSISDHSYDCLRYYCSIKAAHYENNPRRIPPGSFMDVRNEMLKLKSAGMWQNGMPMFGNSPSVN